jgi:hypothetical protein
LETCGLGRIRHLCIAAREKRATTQQPKPNPKDVSLRNIYWKGEGSKCAFVYWGCLVISKHLKHLTNWCECCNNIPAAAVVIINCFISWWLVGFFVVDLIYDNSRITEIEYWNFQSITPETVVTK